MFVFASAFGNPALVAQGPTACVGPNMCIVGAGKLIGAPNGAGGLNVKRTSVFYYGAMKHGP